MKEVTYSYLIIGNIYSPHGNSEQLRFIGIDRFPQDRYDQR